MRSIWSGILSALLVLGFAAGSWAQNGLERFEKEIKPQFELKKFSYASAEPLGSSGFILNDVVAVVPANPATGDKESTVKIQKVTVEEMDFDRMKKDAKDDETPRFAKLKLEGMTGDDEMFTALQPYGVPNVPVDIALDYRIDPAAKVLNLKTLEVSLRGQAKIVFSLVMDGISDKAGMAGAKDDGKLRTASLTIDDSGLLSKAPKGPLTLGLKPAKTAGLSDLDKIMMPNALVTEFGFTASYPGTRAGAAKGGASAAK